MEQYVNKFYGYLAENKLMGQKCDSCGKYRLFPVPVCASCQGTKLSWAELGKQGKLIFFSKSVLTPARFVSLTPCAFGCIELKEGPVFWTLVEGIDIKNPDKEFARLPRDVDIEFREVAGNKIPIARVRREC